MAQLLPQTDLFLKSGVLMFKDNMNTLKRGCDSDRYILTLQTAAELRTFLPPPMLLYFINVKSPIKIAERFEQHC